MHTGCLIHEIKVPFLRLLLIVRGFEIFYDQSSDFCKQKFARETKALKSEKLQNIISKVISVKK